MSSFMRTRMLMEEPARISNPDDDLSMPASTIGGSTQCRPVGTEPDTHPKTSGTEPPATVDPAIVVRSHVSTLGVVCGPQAGRAVGPPPIALPFWCLRPDASDASFSTTCTSACLVARSSPRLRRLPDEARLKVTQGAEVGHPDGADGGHDQRNQRPEREHSDIRPGGARTSPVHHLPDAVDGK